MLVEEQFRALVLAVPEIAALVGSRFRPVMLRPGETLPAATYGRASTRYDNETLEGLATEHPVMQVTLWGFDYVAIKTAINALKLSLRMSNPPAPIQLISVINEEDVFDENFLHADGAGVPGTRLECQVIVCS